MENFMKLAIQIRNIMDSRFIALFVLLISIVCASKADFRCPSKDDISDHPHAESCKKFYRCRFGLPEELSCPCTLHFDSVSRSCTIGDVNCVEGSKIEKWNQSVSANEGVFEMVPHQMICDKYYLCLGPITVERRCAEGLLFDTETKKCTYPGNARCHLDPWCPETDDLKDLRFFPDKENCARYSVCYHRMLHPLFCAEGLFFNVDTNECTLPGWSNCAVRGVDCTIDSELVKHPSKCQSYYECNIGFAFYRECEDGFYFSEPESSCVPDNGECKQLPSTTEQPTTDGKTTSSVTESSSTTTVGLGTSTEGDGGAAGRLVGDFLMTVLVILFAMMLFLDY